MAELRTLTIGDLFADTYFRKIDSIASMLDNLGSKVKDKELVTYAIISLNDRYPHATHIILHSKDFSDLNTVRSMITLDEMQIQRKNRGVTDSQGTPSAPNVLVAQATPQPPSCSSNAKPQICRNFTRGTSQAHLLSIIAAQQNPLAQQHLNRSGSQPPTAFGPRTPLSQFISPPGFNVEPTVNYIGLPTVTGPNNSVGSFAYGQQALFAAPVHGPQAAMPGPISTGLPQFTSNSPISGPGHATSGPTAFSAQPNMSPYTYAVQPSQATIVPNVFSTTTLPDHGNSGWTMDTGASTHLTSSINILTTIFNHCMYPSVAVGDGNLILVTNTGHSVLPNVNRPLHLSNVLVTPNIVKNLISVRKFTRDNKVSVSFDEFGFSVKDYLTRRLLL
ncbi:uncharacterized protein [Rutidosis leptorrhynchoides]|uniref:uncharacterized protein n=1 Tax=Rutidosis leptorrhynchoides TaxID=125765 RepID=UPI003A99639F